MASQLPEQKLLKSITDNCADLRLNEVAVANGLETQHPDIQKRFFNILIAYIYTMSHNYEIGKLDDGTYDISRLSKKIKDLAFIDEYTTSHYEKYGDYEMANDLINLTLFDMA